MAYKGRPTSCSLRYKSTYIVEYFAVNRSFALRRRRIDQSGTDLAREHDDMQPPARGICVMRRRP